MTWSGWWSAEAQAALSVSYKAWKVGNYHADVLVEGELAVELKCVDEFCDEHVAPALPVNFQRPKVEWRRIVYGF